MYHGDMQTLRVTAIIGAIILIGLAVNAATAISPATPHLPVDPHAERAVFAGGCFWGVEAVFERLKGVKDAVSGYAGGNKWSAHYEIVSMGTTGHAESVEVTFDPAVITYTQLLDVFFTVAHDPTQLNRQGPDSGTQYRSSIFYTTEDQKRAALAAIQQLTDEKVFKRKIVTTVVPLEQFYPAEAYHQNFLDRNPTYPYIVYNDLPKIEALKKQFPQLMKAAADKHD
jgi:peptide-methionine (S)-S-oxide reductase